MVTVEQARRQLVGVCAEVGLASDEARLLGPVGDNAVFLLPRERVVVRIASNEKAPEVDHHLAVARWLEEQRFPAVRAHWGIDQPRDRKGLVITFWQEIPGATMAVPAEVGAILRQLHHLPEPAGVLTEFDPFVNLSDYIARATGMPSADREFLAGLLHDLHKSYAEVDLALPRSVIHGDAHRKNIVRDESGQVRLLDLDHMSLGPREWDLIVAAVYHRIGWYSDDEYRGFADAYGFDVTSWTWFPVLAAIRELRMTAWLAARTGREPRLVPEAMTRVESLRHPETPKAWSPGV